jgi:hypothetical protein
LGFRLTCASQLAYAKFTNPGVGLHLLKQTSLGNQLGRFRAAICIIYHIRFGFRIEGSRSDGSWLFLGLIKATIISSFIEVLSQ